MAKKGDEKEKALLMAIKKGPINAGMRAQLILQRV